MWRIRTYRMGIDQGTKVLHTDYVTDGPMWTGEGEREIRSHVQFSEPFNTPPAVMVGLSLWDISSEANSRVEVIAEDVTVEGFELVFRTWGDTKVARARAEWTALGEVPHEDDWDVT